MHNRTTRTAAARGDRELTLAAREAIKRVTTVPQKTIHVTAHRGHLRLEGPVDSLCRRTLIEDVARALPGVQRITNLIWVEADPAFTEVRAVLQ